MQRNLIIILAVLVLLLGAALIFVLTRGETRAPPVIMNAADEKAAEPYHAEMDCIDRLLQQNDLDANQVQPALTRCQGGGGAGNQSQAR